MNNQSQPRVVSSKIAFNNDYFSIRHDKIEAVDGQTKDFYVIDRQPSALIVALTDKKEVLLVKLFRHTTQQVSIEVPGGGIDDDDPVTAAKRELQEETGYTAKDWQYLGELPAAPGLTNQVFHVCLAQQLEQTDTHEMEEEGITEVLKVPLTDLEEMVKQGKITDIQSVGAIYMAKLHLKTL